MAEGGRWGGDSWRDRAGGGAGRRERKESAEGGVAGRQMEEEGFTEEAIEVGARNRQLADVAVGFYRRSYRRRGPEKAVDGGSVRI